MKRKLFYTIMGFIAILFLVSCSTDEDRGYTKWNNQENIVTQKIISNTPNVPITVYAYNKNGEIVKNHWEQTFTTKDADTQISAECEDPSVLITREIYINGKLVQRNDGNGLVQIGFKIK